MTHPALSAITALRDETISFFRAKDAFHARFGPDNIIIISEKRYSHPGGLYYEIQIALSPYTLYCPLYPTAKYTRINDTVVLKTANDGRNETDHASVQICESTSGPSLNRDAGDFEPGCLGSKLEYYFPDCKHESEDAELTNRWNMIDARQNNNTRKEFEGQFEWATRTLAQQIAPTLMEIARDRKESWFDTIQDLKRGNMRRITVMEYKGSNPYACAEIIVEGLRRQLTSLLAKEISTEVNTLRSKSVAIRACALELTMDRLCNAVKLL